MISMQRLYPDKWYDEMGWKIVMLEIGFLLSMTGVGGRPEVVIEGSNDLDGPWLVWLDYFPTFDQFKMS